MASTARSLDIALSRHRAGSMPHWSSRAVFVLAVAGSAVGLGNIWKFPYIVGEHGGGAFVLVYLACILAIGVPILVAELALGRIGGAAPAEAFAVAAPRAPQWRWAGRLLTASACITLSFYSVVAGWAVDYTWLAARDGLGGPGEAEASFAALLADPLRLVVAHTLFIGATGLVIAAGFTNGLERAVRWLMPALFAMLAALVMFAAATSASFGRTLEFLFVPDFGRLGVDAVLVAVGHAFFTLSVGLGGMIAYGAYSANGMSIGRTAVTVAAVDTLVSLMAALAIFPMVFDAGLPPAAGPGLMFVSLPAAFEQLPAGRLLATLFFAFVTIAALTSSISILEPVVNALQRRMRLSRVTVTALATGAAWLAGVGIALSLNVWSEARVAGLPVLDALDALASKVLLPLGGLLIAIAVGWFVERRMLERSLEARDTRWFAVWRWVLRYVSPLAVIAIAVHSLA